MILGIDAANVWGGGSLTHFIELLRVADPPAHGFSKVIVWCGAATAAQLDDRPWLVKAVHPELDGGVVSRAYWQSTRLTPLVREERCDLLFVPGGSYVGDFHPFVVLNHNPVPFHPREIRRYGVSREIVRLLGLRWSQARTLREADGSAVFSRYALQVVRDVVGPMRAEPRVIPHGVDPRFFHAPRPQLPRSAFTPERPFKVLYVSAVNLYKHQWHVVEGLARLRASGAPVTLELVGPGYPQAMRKLRAAMTRFDPGGNWVRYRDALPYASMPACYTNADLFLFASTCETFGLPMVEAMAAGLPIASARRAVAPELLGEGAWYFDPEDPADIARAVEEAIGDPTRRARNAAEGVERARGYTWSRTARETFELLAEVARGGQKAGERPTG